jgi:hypothetical protein
LQPQFSTCPLKPKQFKNKNMLTIFILSVLFGKKPADVKEILFRKKLFFARARIFMTIALVLFMNAANSQGSFNSSSWRFSNPKQFGFTVLDVDYFDNNNVIAVGNDGGIAKSTDGGKNWTYGIFTYTTPAGFQTKQLSMMCIIFLQA